MMTTADLLETIVASARRVTAIRAGRVSLKELEARIVRTPQGEAFAEALRSAPAPRIIAECKRRSPSRGVLRRSYDPASHAAAYAREGAAAISVLTEPTFFDGSLDHLAQVRAAVELPLLRKDFVVTDYQLVEAVVHGADAILLIVSALDDRTLGGLLEGARALGLAVLVEVHDRAELTRAIAAGATIIGVNSRNLRTLSVHPEVLAEVAADLPATVTAVAESGIATAADISRLETLGYHACLVGERLMTQTDPGIALRELRGR